MTVPRDRTLFVYWGRRGAIAQFALELAKVADGNAFFSISRQNELFDQICGTRACVLPVDTFNNSIGALSRLPQLLQIRRDLLADIGRYQIDKVVVLMSHVWTPLVADAVRRAGVRYVVIVHDAAGHPGDKTALVNRWLLRDALKADEIITLGAHVRTTLLTRFPQLKARTVTLFHPVMKLATPVRMAKHETVGFLFFGRILAYKGLPLFTSACELLRARGRAFRVGVAGEGQLGELDRRLRALDATVTNRWLDDHEIAAVVSQYDAIVLSNVEASQSGVVALAHGLGLPVVATPVGGLPEQIEHGQTGLVARAVSAAALADAMELFIANATLRKHLSEGVAKAQETFSMERFFNLITASGNA